MFRDISDGSVNSAQYGHSDWNPDDLPFTHTICPGWLGTDDGWHKLTDFGEAELTGKYSVEVMTASPELVEFKVVYPIQNFGCNKIIRHFRLTPETLFEVDSLTGEISGTWKPNDI